MNLDRYEKIDGREALDRMEKGEEVYDRSGIKFRKIFGEIRYMTMDGAFKATNMSMNHFLFDEDWYIPKPFDVRQAMLDRPNEWVGAFEFEGAWYKVGFDTVQFMSVSAPINGSESVDERIYGVTRVVRDSLDACIPIEDVPEEATR